MRLSVFLAFVLLEYVRGQQAGTQTSEIHPSLTWQKCTTSGGCITQPSSKVVLDANWRWLHTVSGYTNCYNGNQWDLTLCFDPQNCTKNCALDGVDYSGTYGILTSGSSVTLKFVTTSDSGKQVGSRIYLLSNDSTYQMFKAKNQEFTFDVDVSNLPCGLNGALYFSEMAADGGMSKYPSNKAGAKFINGEANLLNWTPSTTNPYSGTGQYGSCCNEMDVWEANSLAGAYISHPCTTTSPTRCSGSDCSSGYCDRDGCDFNSYRMGNKTFYGPGYTVDTSRKITVVTQFNTADKTATGPLSEIRRIYIQNGKVIQNSKTNVPGMSPYDSITEEFCTAQKAAFENEDTFAAKGGLTSMGNAFDNGMVLVMSIGNDYEANMLWLDSDYPVTSSPSKPGVSRGSCHMGGATPQDLEVIGRDSSVVFSNIRFGDIGSTVSST